MKAESLIEVVNWERSRFGESTDAVLQQLEASRDEWSTRMCASPALFRGFPPGGRRFVRASPWRVHDAARIERVLEQGDVLYFDNLRLSHGRGPYLGRRQVRVVFCGLDSSSPSFTTGTLP